MSSLKTNVKASELNRAALNTTINREVFEQFKESCKKSGVAMNVLLETFMRQYNMGGFYLKFGRENKEINVEFDDNKVNVNENIKDNFGEIE